MKKIILCYFIVVLTIGVIKAQSAFTAHPLNPIISFTQPNPGVWNDPSVIKVGSEYWMYATSPNGTSGIFDGNVVPYLLKSSNGINWALSNTAPLLLNNADTTAWDGKGVETPCVVYFNSLYHMYYSAIPKFGNPGQQAIGHATSVDGENWIKDTIIITPSGIPTDWMSYAAGEPGAVVYNNKIYLYFVGVGARQDTTYPGGQSVIGLVISNDGFNFGVPQNVLSQGALYPPALSYYGYSTPNAMVINNVLHLYYDVAKETTSWMQVALHHAYSPDGLSGFIEDTSPIFQNTDFTWTAREIRAPAVLLDSAKVKLWFGADDFFNSGTFGIGYAVSNFTVANNPVSITETNGFNHLQKNILVYPNPSVDKLTIMTSKKNTKEEVLIFNSIGILVKDVQINTESNIDISDLSEGIYFIRSRENLNNATKFIKLH